MIDKTAEHVSQHGTTLEEKVRQNKGSDPKFSFLQPGGTFRLYYERKLRNLKGVKSDSEEEVEVEDDEGDQAKEGNKQFSFIPDDDFRSFLEEVEQKS